LLVAAGAVNVFADVKNPYPQVSIEQVVAAAPDIIILADSLYGVTPDMVAETHGLGNHSRRQKQRRLCHRR
jgi:iron complex transport system substrate-binding protein